MSGRYGGRIRGKPEESRWRGATRPAKPDEVTRAATHGKRAWKFGDAEGP